MGNLLPVNCTAVLTIQSGTGVLTIKTQALVALLIKLPSMQNGSAVNMTILRASVLGAGYLPILTGTQVTILHKRLPVLDLSAIELTHLRTIQLRCTRDLSKLTLTLVATSHEDPAMCNGSVSDLVLAHFRTFHGRAALLSVIAHTLVTPLLIGETVRPHLTVNLTLLLAFVRGAL